MKSLSTFLDAAYKLEHCDIISSISWHDMYLMEHLSESGSFSVSDLANYFHVSLYDISRKISRLISQGFLNKKRSSNDRRVMMVDLTSYGREFLTRMEQHYLDIIHEQNGLTNSGSATEYSDPKNLLNQLNMPACILAPVFTLAGGVLSNVRFIHFNAAFAKQFPGANFLKKVNLLSNYDLPYFDEVLTTVSKVLSSGTPQSIKIYRESGKRICYWQYFPLVSGNLISILSYCKPLQGNGKQYQILQSKYKNFFDCGPVKMVLSAANGQIRDVNQAAVQYYGWTREEFRTMTIFQISTTPPQIIVNKFDIIKKKGRAILYASHRLANGEIRRVEIHTSMGRWEDESVHFSIIFERHETDNSESRTRDSPLEQRDPDISVNSFLPFINRYKQDMPYLADMLEELIPYGKIVNYRRGEHFLEFGEERPNAGFILEGLFRYYTITPDGKDYTLGLYRPAQIFQSLLFTRYNTMHPIALESRTKSRVFIIKGKYLLPLINNDPRWYKLLYSDHLSRLAALQEREISLLNDDATSRYRRFLRDEPDAVAYLCNYHIASYLGITSETLSRIRKKRK